MIRRLKNYSSIGGLAWWESVPWSLPRARGTPAHLFPSIASSEFNRLWRRCLKKHCHNAISFVSSGDTPSRTLKAPASVGAPAQGEWRCRLSYGSPFSFSCKNYYCRPPRSREADAPDTRERHHEAATQRSRNNYGDQSPRRREGWTYSYRLLILDA